MLRAQRGIGQPALRKQRESDVNSIPVAQSELSRLAVR
jgi:hypothetical protein